MWVHGCEAGLVGSDVVVGRPSSRFTPVEDRLWDFNFAVKGRESSLVRSLGCHWVKWPFRR